ncbi:MAG: DUF4150 domain-containing protein [Myxococcota bacterium]
MFPVSTKQDGFCVAAPDVCLVPPLAIPTPFVNLAQCRDAVMTSARVLVANKEVLTQSSYTAMSQGNEPGGLGGIISGVNLGPCRFLSYSSRVLAEGKGVVRHLALTGQNGYSPNMVGCQVSPSQTRVRAG